MIRVFVNQTLDISREDNLPSSAHKQSPSDRDPFYSEKNMRYLRESIRELEEGRGKRHELLDE